MKYKNMFTAGLGALLVVGMMAPTAAIAAPTPTATVAKYVDDNTKSLTTISKLPNEVDRKKALNIVEEAQNKDINGFDQRTKIINASPKTLAYLESFRGLDLTEQVSGLAALMPTDVLKGFTQQVDAGVIEFKVQTLENGTFSSEMIVHEQSSMGTLGFGSLPRCASAWTAFWAWFAVNVTTCGAFTPFPPAAFACAAAFAVGGAIIDFNRGCK